MRYRLRAAAPAAGAKGGRSYIRRAVTGSLRRLRTDYIDLYQLHVPDPVTLVEETLAALHELVTEGKVRYIGHSNFAGWQLADAAHLAARDSRTRSFRPRTTGRCASARPRRRSSRPPGASAWACSLPSRSPTAC